MANRIGIIFLLIVVLGVGLSVYHSGVIGNGGRFLESLRPGASLPSSSPSFSPSFRNTYIPPAAPAANVAITPAPSSVQPQPMAVNPSDLPPGWPQWQVSPYFHEVYFGGFSPASPYSYGTISLYLSLANNTGTIDVTGWQIKTNRSGEYIPQAVQNYDPSGIAAPVDIRLRQGDFLNIYSNSAPVNLRLNKCLGYLANNNQFNPSWYMSCPGVDRSEIQSFTGACQNYILSLGNCQSPNLSDPRVPVNDYACRDYLQSHFTYSSCYDAHRTDPDFFSNEVRVWAGASPLDPNHDTVLLLDANGLLVAYRSY